MMTTTLHILVIDDEEAIRDACEQILVREGYSVETASTAQQALERMRGCAFDVIILDLRLPDADGMDLLRRFKSEQPEVIVVVITGYATIESAVEAMQAGAYDFLPKPFTPETLRVILRRAAEQRRLYLENLGLRSQLPERGWPPIIARSAVMKEILALVRKVGPTESTVLITGESGTGKELIARAIHASSSRRDRVMFTVDCNTLVETLMESELFGHVRGAFTGANTTKHGRFELADGSTLFFDEIGNMDLDIQAKLLRVIQTREFTRIGGVQPIRVDVRIIAATNIDLRKAVQEGTFREDLYYRLNVVPIHLPPLRERKEDIPPLAEYFLKKYREKHKKPIRGISERAMQVLCAYDWPGNVRELENAIECSIAITENEILQPEDIRYLHQLRNIRPQGEQPFRRLRSLAEIEREHILFTLDELEWNYSKAAQVLGIDRKTLRAKVKKYRLERP